MVLRCYRALVSPQGTPSYRDTDWRRSRFSPRRSSPPPLLPAYCPVSRKAPQHVYYNIRKRYWRPKKPTMAHGAASTLARQSFIAFPLAPTIGPNGRQEVSQLSAKPPEGHVEA